jgi:hypothetical protein
MPKCAYIISPDHIHDPIRIEVNLELGQPLPNELCDLRDDFRYIKRAEKREFLKQKDRLLRLNPANKDEGDWHEAKQKVIKEPECWASSLLTNSSRLRLMRLNGSIWRSFKA